MAVVTVVSDRAIVIGTEITDENSEPLDIGTGMIPPPPELAAAGCDDFEGLEADESV